MAKKHKESNPTTTKQSHKAKSIESTNALPEKKVKPVKTSKVRLQEIVKNPSVKIKKSITVNSSNPSIKQIKKS